MSADIGHVFSPKGMGWLLADVVFDLARKLLEALRWFEGLKDDRLIALTGAMLVESALDDLLGELFAGYEVLNEPPNFGLYIKTRLARELRLWPPTTFTAVDTIREIRNAFAHELSYVKLGDLPEKKLNALRDRVKEFFVHHKHAPARLPDTHQNRLLALVSWTVAELQAQRQQAALLNRFLRSGKLVETLQRFHEEARDADPPPTGQ